MNSPNEQTKRTNIISDRRGSVLCVGLISIDNVADRCIPRFAFEFFGRFPLSIQDRFDDQFGARLCSCGDICSQGAVNSANTFPNV